MNDDIVLSLKPVRTPARRENLTDAARQRSVELINLWVHHFGDDNPGTGDFEDFHEDAARLEACIDVFGADHVWVKRNGAAPRNVGTGETRTLDEVADAIQYGVQHTQDQYRPEVSYDLAADRYHGFESFTRHAGRQTRLAGFMADTGMNFVDTVRACAKYGQDGTAKVVIKTRQTKRGMWTIQVPEYATDQQITDIILDALDWPLLNYEGMPEAFLVQEHVPMFNEYRLFVIDGKPVTGAGCIEENTPINSTRIFDNRVRRNRREPDSDVIQDDDTVVSLTRAAFHFIADLRTEKPELLNYVVDMATDAYRNPLVVELNGFLNSGLYASDPTQVVTALREQRARGIHQKGEPRYVHA